MIIILQIPRDSPRTYTYNRTWFSLRDTWQCLCSNRVDTGAEASFSVAGYVRLLGFRKPHFRDWRSTPSVSWGAHCAHKDDCGCGGGGGGGGPYYRPGEALCIVCAGCISRRVH